MVVSFACCCFPHTFSTHPTLTTNNTTTTTPTTTGYCPPCVPSCDCMYPTPTLLLPLWEEYEGSKDLRYLFGVEDDEEVAEEV